MMFAVAAVLIAFVVVVVVLIADIKPKPPVDPLEDNLLERRTGGWHDE